MKTNEVKIEVSWPPWSESEKSWHCLTEQGQKGSWSVGKWFPKSVCNVEPKGKKPTSAIITLPLWLYDKLFNIKTDSKNRNHENQQ